MSTTPTAPVSAAKAVVGAVISGVVAALGVVTTDLQQGADWTNPATYIVIVVAGLVGAGVVGGSVYQVTNKPKA